jgi:phycoerythrobilin:ferredoxin oxidoreductase
MSQITLYQPFLDYAIPLLQARLDLQPYPIPAGFESKSALSGKGKHQEEVLTTSYGYQSDKLRQIRAAHVQGGGSLQVLNFVIFPHLNYDLPFFGADLVTLPGGHLIALDMQPLFRDDLAYQAKYTQPILPIFEAFQPHLPWGGDFPAEAQPFFSPAFLWTRPSQTEVVQTHVFEAFQAYLQAYLDFVEQAQPVTDPQRLAEIEQAQLRYLRYRAEKDPARGMFTRFYGSEWTEEYIHGFLFDLERKLAIAS